MSATTYARLDPDQIASRTCVAIVANPFSGAGKNRQIVDELIAALRERGLEAEVLWDRATREQLLHDPTFHKKCRCVVAAGGDGTVGDVINMQPGLPLAMLPIGNENLFAREFGYQRGPQILADAIAAGLISRIDLGEIREQGGETPQGKRFFSLMLTAGIDADIVHRVAAWRAQGETMKRVKRLSYVGPTFEALRKYDYPPLTLTTENGREVTGSFALIFNIPQYALGLPFTPDATPDDELLDFVMFKKSGPIRLARYALSLLSARHLLREDVEHGQARALTLTSPIPAPLQIDGDPAGSTPISIEICPRSLEIVRIPRHYGKSAK